MLRYISGQFKKGALSKLNEEELHAYLKDQAVGLVQANGLAMHNADGSPRAISWVYPAPETTGNVAALPAFQTARDNPNIDMLIGPAIRSRLDGLWFFPIGRRLETASGQFAGTIAARGRIDYFQDFYRDVQLDKATKVTLMHRDGTLLARYPPAEAALGKHFPPLDLLLAERAAGRAAPMRMVSPIDGVERYVALTEVPSYSMIVLVSRDASVALAAWREQAIGTAVRTLALGALAALLLMLLMRKLARLRAASASLEASKERFAAAVAGSDDGIWDWDVRAKRVFVSARAREILGVPPGPERTTRANGSLRYDFIRTIKLDASRRWMRILPAARLRMRSSIEFSAKTATGTGCAHAACAFATPMDCRCASRARSAILTLSAVQRTGCASPKNAT